MWGFDYCIGIEFVKEFCLWFVLFKFTVRGGEKRFIEGIVFRIRDDFFFLFFG